MAGSRRRWTLAYLDLVELPFDLVEKYGNIVEELDLSNNRLTDLRFMSEFPKVSTLILDHNNVTCQVKLPPLPELHTLWVNHNKITNLGVFIATISQNCPNLAILCMMNNEAAPSYFNGGTYQQYVDYRYYVISKIASLEVLDDKKISPNERTEAERIYRKPIKKSRRSGGSRLTRKESGCLS